MSESFRPTEKQRDLFRLIAGPAKHIMAFGGSRSAKTFAFLRAIAFRALAAEGSRHGVLRLKMFYDCNPPLKTHWTYQVFISKQDPDSRQPLRDPHNYAALQMNPRDNAENLPADYFAQLDGLPARMRVRFRDGEFGDAAEGALWTPESIERWREADTPDLQRIVIGIDPSGSGDVDNAGDDAIGITVAGLGTDGSAYVLEDLSIKAGPAKWGAVPFGPCDRHHADMIVGEGNFGGEMVRVGVQAAGSQPQGRGETAP